jgi:hypothetical protein
MAVAQNVKTTLGGVLTLPRRLEDVPIVIFRRQYSAQAGDVDQLRVRNFRVRRQAVLSWLNFLRLNHTDYQALNVEVDEGAMQVRCSDTASSATDFAPSCL